MEPLGEGAVVRLTDHPLFPRMAGATDSVGTAFGVGEISAEAGRPAIYGAQEIGYITSSR